MPENADTFAMAKLFFAVLLLTILFAPTVFADLTSWSFPTFANQKVRLIQSTLASGTPLIFMIDNECAARSSRQLKKIKQSSSLYMQHNILPQLRYQAVRVNVGTATNSRALQNLVASETCVMGVVEDAAVTITGFPGDPRADEQVALPSIHQQGGENYFFHPLWGIRQAVVAAMVDTGIQIDHPDLQSRLWRDSANFAGINILNHGSPSDDNGHGTHISGLLGAQRDNGVGIRGVMGESVQLMAVKTLGADGGGTLADVINGIRWATDHGAEVLNLSLESRVDNPALKDVLNYALSKNVVIVVAAGNDGSEITTTNFLTPIGYAPDLPGLIGVGSYDVLSSARATFSNYSSHYVELSAPGSAGADGLLSTYVGSSYLKLAGTSMSAPQVSGAAALAIGFLKTRGVVYRADQIETLIEQAASSNQNLMGSFASGRQLDVQRLGRLLYQSYIWDADGGFDAEP